MAKNTTFPLFIKCLNPSSKNVVQSNAAYIQKLAGVTNVEFVDDKSEIGEKFSQCATPAVEIFVPLGKMVDFDKEIERIEKELAKLDEEISKREAMLSNAGFVAKAPKQLVEAEKSRLAENKTLQKTLLAQLENLK